MSCFGCGDDDESHESLGVMWCAACCPRCETVAIIDSNFRVTPTSDDWSALIKEMLMDLIDSGELDDNIANRVVRPSVKGLM